jgi:uncharacterized protein YqeY
MEPTLRQRLETDLKSAMKSGDQTSRDTIRFTLAAITNAEIDKRGALAEDEASSLLQREVKRRVDSIEQFRAANRIDLVDREESQLRILQRYLPAAMTDEELATTLSAIITELGASTPKDMGRVMPVAIERTAGKVDGRRLSTAVKNALAAESS